MSQLTLVTWQSSVEAMVEEVLDAASRHPRDSQEREALCVERDLLRNILVQVRDVPASDRRQISSHVLGLSVREPISIPDELIGKISCLFQFYERNRERLEWRESIPPSSD
jgi:hypothetical protein